MLEGYSVTVSKHGEPILMIESAMLSGADLSQTDMDAIRAAGDHLVGFAGPVEHDKSLVEVVEELRQVTREHDVKFDLNCEALRRD